MHHAYIIKALTTDPVIIRSSPATDIYAIYVINKVHGITNILIYA